MKKENIFTNIICPICLCLAIGFFIGRFSVAIESQNFATLIPQTGDDSDIQKYIDIMCIAGIGLIFLLAFNLFSMLTKNKTKAGITSVNNDVMSISDANIKYVLYQILEDCIPEREDFVEYEVFA